MADMFGSPLGIIASDENYRHNLITGLKSQQMLGELAMQPVDLRIKTAAAEEAEMKLSQEKAFTKLLQEGPGTAMNAGAEGKPVSISTKLNNLAQRAAAAGMVDRAGKLAKTAAEINKEERAAENQEVQTQLNRTKAIVGQAELIGQFFGNVANEEELQTANELWQMHTKTPSPLAGVAFDKGLIKRLNDAALSAKEKADIENRRVQQEATDTYRKAMLEGQAANRTIAKERLGLERERQETKGKTAGNAGATPSDKELLQVSRELKTQGIDTAGMDSESVNLVKFSIASRAKELQARNKALGDAQAIAQATEEAKNNGELEVVTTGGATIAGIQFGGKKEFMPKKASKAITTTLPTTADGKPDASKLVTGKVYQTARGPAKYLGNGRFVSE